ncbi:uncharacterized protein LOC132037799 isoform X2 [Lycium ferocissimum]|uniref:uncharacterized protein LOC132037799 isoform X2 n=1 Tax=Lycium ferocissimum TaxID=112874 RepID=UPI00281676B2|nr:uncharacterized protein LOC132037799 isoform X2 [Lycium ferocissimum]
MILPFFLFHLPHRSNFSGGIATFRRSSSSESFLRLSLKYIIIRDIRIALFEQERKLRNEVLHSKQVEVLNWMSQQVTLQHWRQIRSDKTGPLLGEVLKKLLQGHRAGEKFSVDQLVEVDSAKKWNSQPCLSRGMTSSMELSTLEIKNAENLTIPSVRNDLEGEDIIELIAAGRN